MLTIAIITASTAVSMIGSSGFSRPLSPEYRGGSGDKTGQIEDLVIENGKTLTGVVVSTGGFLGIGER